MIVMAGNESTVTSQQENHGLNLPANWGHSMQSRHVLPVPVNMNDGTDRQTFTMCQPCNILSTCPGCTLPFNKCQLGLAPVPHEPSKG